MHPMLGCVQAMPIPLHSQTRGGTPAAHKHLLTKPFNLKMKKFVLSLLVALTGISASAQVYVGGEAGFWRNADDNHTTFTIQPEIGYNLNESWDLGIALGYSHDYSKGIEENAFNVNPYARYTYAKFGAVSLFLDGTFGINTYKVKNASDSMTGWQVGIKPGIRVNLAKNVDFVAHCGFLGYRDADNDQSSFGENGFGFNLNGNNLTFGINYRF